MISFKAMGNVSFYSKALAISQIQEPTIFPAAQRARKGKDPAHWWESTLSTTKSRPKCIPDDITKQGITLGFAHVTTQLNLSDCISKKTNQWPGRNEKLAIINTSAEQQPLTYKKMLFME